MLVEKTNRLERAFGHEKGWKQWPRLLKEKRTSIRALQWGNMKDRAVSSTFIKPEGSAMNDRPHIVCAALKSVNLPLELVD